ncbi:MAG TPA: hypothetical protein PLB25_08280 [Rhodoferax sp.]|nr:hypothetical protein [Rhodoferax sp.]
MPIPVRLDQISACALTGIIRWNTCNTKTGVRSPATRTGIFC